jgi:hypothetical protein
MLITIDETPFTIIDAKGRKIVNPSTYSERHRLIYDKSIERVLIEISYIEQGKPYISKCEELYPQPNNMELLNAKYTLLDDESINYCLLKTSYCAEAFFGWYMIFMVRVNNSFWVVTPSSNADYTSYCYSTLFNELVEKITTEVSTNVINKFDMIVPTMHEHINACDKMIASEPNNIYVMYKDNDGHEQIQYCMITYKSVFYVFYIVKKLCTKYPLTIYKYYKFATVEEYKTYKILQEIIRLHPREKYDVDKKIVSVFNKLNCSHLTPYIQIENSSYYMVRNMFDFWIVCTDIERPFATLYRSMKTLLCDEITSQRSSCIPLNLRKNHSLYDECNVFDKLSSAQDETYIYLNYYPYYNVIAFGIKYESELWTVMYEPHSDGIIGYSLCKVLKPLSPIVHPFHHICTKQSEEICVSP